MSNVGVASRYALKELVEKRRAIPNNNHKERAAISKIIQKEVKRSRQKKMEEAIQQILDNSKGIKSITAIKGGGRRNMITHMVDSNGVERAGRQEIADIFEKFYAQLYTSTERLEECVTNEKREQESPIQPFDLSELRGEIKNLRSKRAKDTAGVVAEMLKEGKEAIEDILLRLFNAILSGKADPPEAWKESIMTVLYKKGDEHKPENYRPITIIPILYKLFARLLARRIGPILEKHQSKDQAGFRKGFSTTDHLWTVAQVREKANEWQQPLWVAALDFQKAFDTVEHRAIWTALARQGVPHAYLQLLSALYSNQKCQVRTDKLSQSFDLQRGTKQGDPLSSMLFNAVLEDTLRDVKQQWNDKRRGIKLGEGPSSLLTNLRFADDLLLLAATRADVRQMLGDVVIAAKKRGLQLHPDKTKILCNTSQRRGRAAQTSITVEGMNIEVVPFAGSVKYLGSILTFDEPMRAEIDHRVSMGWKKFMSPKEELTTNKYSVRSRLRLFDSTVTPTVLYGAATWTLTKDMENKIVRTQRRMLRMVLGHRRRYVSDGTLETWIAWVRRTTHEAEALLSSFNIENWDVGYKRRKWRWAQKIATTESDTWAYAGAMWEPELNHKTCRQIGRPKLRWSDDITELLRSNGHTKHWVHAAAETWDYLEDEFVGAKLSR